MRLDLVLARSLVLSAAALVAVGCNDSRDGSGNGGADEDAGPTGPTQELRRIESLGVSNGAGCGVGASDTEAAFVFNLIDVDDDFVGPGAIVGGQTVAVGDTFSASNIGIDEAVLYPSPDIPCATDADCADSPVPNSLCLRLNSDDDRSETVCGAPTSVGILQDGLSLVPGEAASGSKGVYVTMANGDSIKGFFEGESGDEFSSDPDGVRLDAVTTFLDRFDAAGFNDESVACLSVFAGASDTDHVTWLPDGEDNCFISLADPDGRSSERIADLQQVRVGRLPSAAGGRAVDAAISEGIDAFLGASEGASEGVSARFDRHLVVFTDGPDDGADGGSNPVNGAYRYTRLVQRANDANIKVHIIQLDASPTVGETGALDEYARMACETGGTYQYVRDPEGLRGAFRSLAIGLDRRYALQLQFPDLEGLPAGAYRLSARVLMAVGGTTRDVYLNGDNTTVLGDPIDTRLTLFVRPVDED